MPPQISIGYGTCCATPPMHPSALAAEVLGYTPDKRAVVGDLAYGVTDPDESVRNNATRALAVIATYAGRNPQAGIKISPRPFVDLLICRLAAKFGCEPIRVAFRYDG